MLVTWYQALADDVLAQDCQFADAQQLRPPRVNAAALPPLIGTSRRQNKCAPTGWRNRGDTIMQRAGDQPNSYQYSTLPDSALSPWGRNTGVSVALPSMETTRIPSSPPPGGALSLRIRKSLATCATFNFLPSSFSVNCTSAECAKFDRLLMVDNRKEIRIRASMYARDRGFAIRFANRLGVGNDGWVWPSTRNTGASLISRREILRRN